MGAWAQGGVAVGIFVFKRSYSDRHHIMMMVTLWPKRITDANAVVGTFNDVRLMLPNRV